MVARTHDGVDGWVNADARHVAISRTSAAAAQDSRARSPGKVGERAASPAGPAVSREALPLRGWTRYLMVRSWR